MELGVPCPEGGNGFDRGTECAGKLQRGDEIFVFLRQCLQGRPLRGDCGGMPPGLRLVQAPKLQDVHQRVCDARVPVPGDLLQRTSDHCRERGRALGFEQRLRLFTLDAVQRPRKVGSFERLAAAQHEVEHRAEREDVAALIDVLAPGLLR